MLLLLLAFIYLYSLSYIFVLLFNTNDKKTEHKLREGKFPDFRQDGVVVTWRWGIP